MPNIQNSNIFINNTAIKYGDSIASYPIRIVLNIYSLIDNSMVYNSLQQNETAIINISAGIKIDYKLVFHTRDIYNKLVDIDEGYLIYI